MDMKRRSTVTTALAVVAAAVLPSVSTPVHAQQGAGPVKLVVGYAPGGPSDILARLVAKALADQLGQPVVVENRAGASGTIAVQSVVRAAADGQTLLFGTEVDLAIVPHLMTALPYDPRRDLRPVTAVAEQISVLVVRKSLDVQTVADLVARAKLTPGALTYGSAGSGTPAHMVGALLEKVAAIRLNHVPYKGAGPALSDLLGGHIDAMFLGGQAALGPVRAGQLRALAVTGRKRSALLPGVPTFAEAGVVAAGLDAGNWLGIFVPAATSQPVTERFARAWQQAAGQQELLTRLDQMALEIRHDDAAALSARIDRDFARWGQIISSAGIKAE